MKEQMKIVFALLAAIVLAGSAVASADVAVSVSPSVARLGPGESLSFAATVTGTTNDTVTWSVLEGAAAGTIDIDGTYTAPTTAGTYHVVATSDDDSSQSATAAVTVVSRAAGPQPVVGVSISVSPMLIMLAPRGTQTFRATVTGTSNTAVEWSIDDDEGGTISAAGLYTAPARSGRFTVTATSVADPEASASAEVNVRSGIGISLNPPQAVVAPRGTVQFRATVTGTTNTAVSYVAFGFPFGGTISAAGLFTAPSASCTYTIMATPVADPGAIAMATVIVDSTVDISVSPSFARLARRAQRTFAATVTGSTNRGVTWSVEETGGGTITSAGVYTAPNVSGLYHAEATSAADTGKTAKALVVVDSGIKVVISPAVWKLGLRAQKQFTATVTGTTNRTVVWSAEEGTITSAGLYTAPAISCTDVITAASADDPGAFSRMAVIVSSNVAVAVSPKPVTLRPNATQQFRATVTGTTTTAVEWN